MTQTIAELVAALGSESESVQIRALGRLMTRVVDDPQAAAELRAVAADERRRPANVIGITGPPGAGKSTLTDALLSRLLHRDPHHRIVVLAVDPSSPFTGGAILGDRVRMMRHALDRRVFIRSLATRGELGGLCRGVADVLVAAALWGADTVIIETVGVGQNEIDVARLADCTCLVLAPGQGDGVQWLKSGLMEIGDLYVVNKSDREGAATLVAQLSSAVERMQMLARRRKHSAPFAANNMKQSNKGTVEGPPVLAVSAETGDGIDALLNRLHILPETADHV